jgi:5-methylcytosine-specific restriction endonuclease McrA
MKTCKTCGDEKPFSEYHKHKTTKDGCFPECKDCHRTRQRKWAQNNKGRHAEFYSKWRGNNLAKRSADQREYKSKKYGQMSLLAQTPLSKILIDVIYESRDFYTKATDIPHDVDHIHPISKGGEHAPWNLQILTASANRSKGAKLGVQV